MIPKAENIESWHPAGGQLEVALLQIMQRHHHESLRQRKQTERAKMDAVRSAARVADLLVATVDSGVQELYINEKRIELEARALLATIAWYRKQTDQWLAATNAINCLEVSCRTVKGSGSSSRKKMETADDHEYCYYYYEEQASSVAVGALTMANTGLGFPSLLPFPSSTHRAGPAVWSCSGADADADHVLISGSGLGLGLGLGSFGFGSALSLSCSGGGMARTQEGSWMPERRGEERRRRGLHVHQLELEKTNLLPGTLYPLQERLERGRAEQRAVGQGLKARPGGGSIGGGRAPAGEWARAAAGAREGGGGGAAAQAQVPRGRGGRRARQAQDADLLPCSLKSTGREIPDNLFNGSNFLKFLKIYCFIQHDGHYNSVLCCSPHSTHKPV
uniref:Biogenesis of lysosome-related organelles complex 1 subunit 1 n=1 Tax=Oryza rufipogon TaxID=4529 RepID=A0A0E0RGG2_ORYRU